MNIGEMKLVKQSEGYLDKALNDRTPPEGCIVLEPLDNELFIDIDGQPAMERHSIWYENVQYILEEIWGLDEYKKWPSRKENCWHICIRLRTALKDTERIALQALLASDPVREIMSLARIREEIPKPTIFFERDNSGTPD